MDDVMPQREMLALLASALDRRSSLLRKLHAERTDCYRLLHGSAEGVPGVTVDRYGPVLLVQTWRQPLSTDTVEAIAEEVAGALGERLVPAHRHRRGKAAAERTARVAFDRAAPDPIGYELGIAYDVRPYHRGQDPLLFIDLRAGRRYVRDAATGATVLNVFAYTCGMGVCAAMGGASEVVNVDVALSALEIGMRNAERNGVTRAVFKTVHEDAIPVLRQVAGLHVKGRSARRRGFMTFEPRQFDIVVLDPPRWAKGPFGAVDVVRDYAALFKPAVMATRPGGHVLATNHVPSVPLAAWLETLHRCARKAGRPLDDIEVVHPEADVPARYGQADLKIAWVTVGRAADSGHRGPTAE